jgi:perosamine synthetase
VIPAARPEIGELEREAVDRVLRSGVLAQGPEVAAFENEFSAEVVSGAHSIAVNSGTSALHLSMLALDIGPGDEVIVPSFTFAATANSVALTGAKPIFADIDPDTFTMDPSHVEALISSRTRAVMPVHLYGHPADMTTITRICEKYKLALFEDAAQAHAAEWESKRIGTWGLVSSFSFYPTKNMTSGEGGMVTTRDSQIARKIRLLRNQGQERRYENEIIGLNNRMTEIHAAIGRVQLTRLSGWTARRREIASKYDRELMIVKTPPCDSKAFHVYHQYTIRVDSETRDEFAEKLAAKGVGTGVYYPIPVHRLPAYSSTDVLPNTELAARECLSLPVYPSLSDEQVAFIIDIVNEVAQAL